QLAVSPASFMPALTTLFHATPTMLPYLLVHSNPLPATLPVRFVPLGKAHRSVFGFSYQSTLRPTSTPRPLSDHIDNEQAFDGDRQTRTAAAAANAATTLARGVNDFTLRSPERCVHGSRDTPVRMISRQPEATIRTLEMTRVVPASDAPQ